jgi:DNA-binding NtrC family response regulator
VDLQSVKQRFGIIGNSDLLDRALEVALRVAATDLSVLITGESGVGKEFFPQIIHAYGARKHNRYIAVNCGAIPGGTIDSELFGHEKGAFTGATEARKGYFEEANGGTIFLDEVAELPLSTQVRLLRVLQDGEYLRVGSSKVQKTDVRVVAATNINLQTAVGQGRFREDLYYRLNTVPIHVPPLRDRREDICLLFRRFAVDVATQYRMPVIALDARAQQVLENYAWPGNIRQLKNVAEQISAVEETRQITAEILVKYLPSAHSQPAIVGGWGEMGGEEREALYKALFNLQAEVTELRRLVMESRGVVPVGVPVGMPMPAEEKIAGLLPASTPEYVETEEVSDGELTKEQVERERITRALRRHNGRRKDAAKELFISERTLYRKIKELGIDEN